MNITLVNLPKSFSGQVGEPYGLEMLAASLKGRHNVRVLDAQIMKNNGELLAALKNSKPAPDVIGISAQPSSQSELTALVRGLDRVGGRPLVVVGGHLVSSAREIVLEKNPLVDVGVVGMGGAALSDIVDAYGGGSTFEGMPNIIFRLNGKIISTRRSPVSLDGIPWADRALYEEYCGKGLIDPSKVMIFKSGGCAGICSFCMVHEFFPRSKMDGMANTSWLTRSPTDVSEEMMHLFNAYWKNCGKDKFTFDFVDSDAFGLRPGDWTEISANLKKSGLSGRINYWISLRLDEFINNQDVLASMASTGLAGVFLGLESSIPSDLRVYRKNLTVFGKQFDLDAATLEQMVSNVKIFCARHNLRLKLGWVNVHADSCLSDVKDSIAFLERNHLLYNVGSIIKQVAVYRGSTIFKQYASRGLITEFDEGAEWMDKKCPYQIIDPQVSRLIGYFKRFKTLVLPKEDELRTNIRFVGLDADNSITEFKYYRLHRDVEYSVTMHFIKLVEQNAPDKEFLDAIVGAQKKYVSIFGEYLLARESQVRNPSNDSSTV